MPSAAIAKEGACARLDNPLVRHVREDEPLDAHEAGAAREGHGQRTLIRAGQHLDADRHGDGALHFVADDGERRHDLRTHVPFEVGTIVRVLDHHAVEAGGRVDSRFRNRRVDNLIDALATFRRAGQPAGVNDADQRARDAEE
jgi:hypothetical protein